MKCKKTDLKTCKILGCVFERNVSKCKGVTLESALNSENSAVVIEQKKGDLGVREKRTI